MSWLVAAALFAIFLTQPTGIKLQFALSLLMIAVMFTISTLRLTGLWRHVFLASASVVIIRYLHWRLTETLPSVDQVWDFVPAILLLAAELYYIVILGLGLFVNAQSIRRPRAPQLPGNELPSVDVFVPSYNEERDLVAVTLAAAKRMDYPSDRLTVYLLDDGGTDEKVYSANAGKAAEAAERRRSMQQLCVELGVRYLTRERNVHAKAGNLNNGLAYSTSDLVVVFDADHVPAREFLRETVGHFAREPRLFLVQTPHFFINADPIERNLSTFSRMPSENEMFYGEVQRGLDSWNSAFFCGSAAVLRRSALEEVGGFAGVSITEDCETALELHARGWKSLYVETPLIAGLQPETFESFIGQRSRWCQGMMQIFMLKNPLLNRGLNLPQKLCYASSNLFWLFPLPRLAFMISPLFFIFFNMQIYHTSPQQFVAYTAFYIVAVMMMQNYMYGRLRWPWVSELYEYVQSLYLVRALAGVIVNPRAPKFNVTQKGAVLDDDHLSGLALPFYIMFGILAAGAGYTVIRYINEPASRGLLLVVGAWNIFNLVLAGIALGAVSERRERRKVQRLATDRTGELIVNGEAVPVRLTDASIGGVRLLAGGILKQPIAPGRQAATLRVAADGAGASYEVPVLIASAVSTEGERVYGVRFTGIGADRYRLIADVAYADLSSMRAMRARRHKRRNLVLVSAETLGWSFTQTLRGLFFAAFRRNPPTQAAVPAIPIRPVAMGADGVPVRS
ncbi:cellulose synthase catalytic subunit [Bosea sp. BIWAKO-01]|nr:cellulose synthase catalytic subunit [Bosea sp. BIWAKO-01]